jgi:6-phosphogluconolactonase
LQLSVAASPEAVARDAARTLADWINAAVIARGRALIGLSGGETPWLMLHALGECDLPWSRLYVAQVDERIAPDCDPRRNLTRQRELLLAPGRLPTAQLLAMPVTERDLDRAAAAYQATLEAVGCRAVVFDVVQLGLGADGHTASLVPGDPALDVLDRDVAVTGEYQGTRRMTLTFPALNRARRRLWLVTGAAKRQRLHELIVNEGSSPSLRVSREHAFVFADSAAAPQSRGQ